MAKILNCCPVCGGKIEYISLWQYDYIYKINKNGTVGRYMRRECVGPMEAGFFQCENEDFVTNCDFEVVTPNDLDIKVWSSDNGKFYYGIDE